MVLECQVTPVTGEANPCPFPCPVSEVKAFNQSLSGHSTGKVALQIFGNASEILV
jgi:hypothetical protein